MLTFRSLFFSFESICSRRTRGIRRFSEKAAVAHMEFVAFPEKVAVTERYLLFYSKSSRHTHGIRCFPEKVAVTKRYLCFFSKRRSLTEDICIFSQKKAIPRRYLYFFPKRRSPMDDLAIFFSDEGFT